MTPQEFKEWRNRFNLTQEDAGQLLDRNARSIYRLETAGDDVPIDVVLACEGVELSEMIGSNKGLILNLIPRAGDERTRAFLRDLLKVEPAIERYVVNRIKKEIASVRSPA